MFKEWLQYLPIVVTCKSSKVFKSVYLEISYYSYNEEQLSPKRALTTWLL
jgi:hypothetical protein